MIEIESKSNDIDDELFKWLQTQNPSPLQYSHTNTNIELEEITNKIENLLKE